MRHAPAAAALVVLLLPLVLAGPAPLGPADEPTLPALPITTLPPPPAPAFITPAPPSALPTCAGASLPDPLRSPPQTAAPPVAPNAADLTIPPAVSMPAPSDPAWAQAPNGTWTWTNGSATWERNATGWRYHDESVERAMDRGAWTYADPRGTWRVGPDGASFDSINGSWRMVNGAWAFAAENVTWRYANGAWALANATATWRANATEWLYATANEVWRYTNGAWSFTNGSSTWRYTEGEWTERGAYASPFGVRAWSPGATCDMAGGPWSVPRAPGWEEAIAGAADATALSAAARPDLAEAANASGVLGAILADGDRYHGAQVGAQVDVARGHIGRLTGALGLLATIDLATPLRAGAAGGAALAFTGGNVSVALHDGASPSVAIASEGVALNVSFAPGAIASLEGRMVDLGGSGGQARAILLGEGVLRMRADGFVWTPAHGGLLLVAKQAQPTRIPFALASEAIAAGEVGAIVTAVADASGSIVDPLDLGLGASADARPGSVTIQASSAAPAGRAIVVRTTTRTLGDPANVTVLVDGAPVRRTPAPEGALRAEGSAAFVAAIGDRIEAVVGVPSLAPHTITLLGEPSSTIVPPTVIATPSTPTPTATTPSTPTSPSTSAPARPVIPDLAIGALVSLAAVVALAKRRA